MSNANRSSIQLAVIGGTGKEGSGLALRWANAGYSVITGSRDREKAERVSTELNRLLGTETIRGLSNEQAAAQATIVIITVPYTAHQTTLESIREAVQGKIVVDVTVPIAPPRVTEVVLPKGRTAAEEAQAILGDDARVVSAFQNVSAVHLKDPAYTVQCDVLITGDDENARREVIALAEAIGLRGIDAGPLANAIVAESLTPVLLGINRRYGTKDAGLHITNLKSRKEV
ncbi:MAG: NADPH-dependent F420 reductase [Anaerolineae bacterium]|nr:NADPH-dependent F420 reductase [Anaerolineae bacterium]